MSTAHDRGSGGTVQPGPARRQVLGWAIGAAAASVGVALAYPALRFAAPCPMAAAEVARLGAADDFARGAAKSALLGGMPIVVLRDAEGQFHAFVALCPHLQGVVRYVEQQGIFECACHRSRFAADGRNIAGPAPRPLAPLRVNLVDGVVVVSAS